MYYITMLQNKTPSLKFQTNQLFRQTKITTVKTLAFSTVNGLECIQAEPSKTSVKDLVQLFENTTAPHLRPILALHFFPSNNCVLYNGLE